MPSAWVRISSIAPTTPLSSRGKRTPLTEVCTAIRRPSGEARGSMSVSLSVFVTWVRPLPSVAIDQIS